MAELKTKETDASVKAFLARVTGEERRKDAATLVRLMTEATKSSPRMWGSSIVGFGSYHYRYASGHEGDSCVLGFSPRKDAFALYLSCGLNRLADLLEVLGKHKSGKGCLYIRRLDEVDLAVLKKMMKKTVTELRAIQKERAAGK